MKLIMKLPVMLKHDDLNSMYNSIENRSPFLDKDLITFPYDSCRTLYKRRFSKKNTTRCWK